MGEEPPGRKALSLCFVEILVEGQTEEQFVKKVLAPSLQVFNVQVDAVIHSSKVIPDGPNFRGGGLKYERVRKETENLLRSPVDLVTTMFDYYELPGDFPGMATATGTPQQRVSHIEQAYLKDVISRFPNAQNSAARFRPFIMLHEFEALLFADPSVTAKYLGVPNLSRDMERALQRHNGSPEEINSSFATSPSHIIKNTCSGYQKVSAGITIVAAIGLGQLCSACPHFGAWVAGLKSLTCP